MIFAAALADIDHSLTFDARKENSHEIPLIMTPQARTVSDTIIAIVIKPRYLLFCIVCVNFRHAFAVVVHLTKIMIRF